MEKRVLLAVVLSFIVLYGYQALFPPRRTPPRTPAPSAAGTETAASQKPTPAAPPPAVPAPAEAPSSPGAQPLVSDASDREIVVESDSVRAVFSTKGAVLKSWQLKKYLGEDGKPLDLVPSRTQDGPKRPFTLETADAAIDSTLANALFKPSHDSLNSSTAGSLSFEYRDAAGLQARKEFAFTPDHPYLIGFTASVQRGGTAINPTVEWGPAIGTGAVSSGLTYSPSSQPIFMRDRDVERVRFDKVHEQRVVEGNLEFAGVDDHYFLSVAIPGQQPLHVEYDPIAVPVQGSDRGLHFVDWSVRYPSPPANEKFFFGPKDFDQLKAVDPEFTYAIDFGMFSLLVVPLLGALKWVNGYVHNYGWSIIVLTGLINIAMFPLRHKSVVSMRRMQEIQPEVKAIQDRYAKLKMTDPARSKMNTEMMNLYRERGVNPASGCVPMLLTMPVLFAFYAMLSVAIELRGAPWIGWIQDLSRHDPLFITPIVMGITQFIQTKMSPATGDPMQQKMMLFMPLIFMTMFIWAPSGLVLYWTVSNLWAIGQQALTNRIIGPPSQKAVRPPAERRIKSAGGGRTDAAKERK